MKQLKGAKVLNANMQKTISGGVTRGQCRYRPYDSCPSGTCCDVNTRRCVLPSQGLCV